jgi:predicted MFS family arabinose efflux permease
MNFLKGKQGLIILVFSQFAGTSLWFAGNVMVAGLAKQGEDTSLISFLSSMVQAGFICGTLVFAILMLPDRIRASRLFFICSLLAAISNLSIFLNTTDVSFIALMRFLTGFFIAGIYPVGMKIAAEKFPADLGNALGFLVGALVLGTAIPHLLTGFADWQNVLLTTSFLAVVGGVLVLMFLPSNLPGAKNKFDPSAIITLFRSRNFRASAFGYFGHMWELYAFWAFVPMIILQFYSLNATEGNPSIFSFLTIAAGTLGCIAGGLLSKRKGSRQIAFFALLISGFCCLVLPFSLQSGYLFYPLMLIWGFTVVADSPQFSTMVARSATPEYKGTALTIVTSLGFAITILSIQLLNRFFELGQYAIWLLLPGPILGLIATYRYKSLP